MTPNTRTTKRAGDDSLHAGLDCYAPPRKRRSAPFESNSTQSDTQRDQLEHNLQDQLDTCNYTAPLPQPIPVRPRKSLPKPVSILATTKGLDLEQVRELDQNPEGKDYFPQPYSPLAVDLPITDADSVPDDAKDPACHRYTAWCIQEIRKARASNIIARMMADPSLTIKWNLYLRRTWKNRELVLKELQLAPSHTTNHEGTFVRFRSRSASIGCY
ncbi:hypothetical protein GGS26DRAFT_324658 [Hypomontagnella submonticulosa]|nr:hypothetical protein GGS26DRAFT_324658 [Hypomontagnella submonticulosa]